MDAIEQPEIDLVQEAVLSKPGEGRVSRYEVGR